MELRDHIRHYLENGKPILNDAVLKQQVPSTSHKEKVENSIPKTELEKEISGF